MCHFPKYVLAFFFIPSLILSPSAQGERVFADLVTVASDITAKTLEPLTKKEQDQFLRLLSKLK